MQSVVGKNKNEEQTRLFRSPTLDTVAMVEETIKKHSGELNKTKLWGKLPRKVMWPTYSIIIKYLESINKIAIAKGRILVYIWNPVLAQKYMKKRGLKYEKK